MIGLADGTLPASVLVAAAGVGLSRRASGNRANWRSGTVVLLVALAGTIALGRPIVALLVAAPAFAIGCAREDARRRARAARRDRAVRRQLPQALELLGSVLDGGAPTYVALSAIADRCDEPLASALRDVAGGAAPAPPAMRALAALLRASDELGTPLAGEVRTLAEDTREAIVRDTRLRAAAAGPKLMLVVGGLLAPAALLLIVGSEVLTVIASLRGIG
jgi:pilus assembly protein TadC